MWRCLSDWCLCNCPPHKQKQKRHRCCKEVLNFNKRRKSGLWGDFFFNLSLLCLELVTVRSIFHRARLIRPPPVPGVFPHFGASHESCANQNAHQCLPPSPRCPPLLKNISFNCAMKRKKKKSWWCWAATLWRLPVIWLCPVFQFGTFLTAAAAAGRLFSKIEILTSMSKLMVRFLGIPFFFFKNECYMYTSQKKLHPQWG